MLGGLVMILTTSNTIEGRAISEYLGIVTGAQIFHLSVGAKGADKKWATACNDVLSIMKKDAAALGANAVIAIRFCLDDYRAVATGTAVKLEA
jgi:uncharacterized protein YbjQ (UPF0145 family)